MSALPPESGRSQCKQRCPLSANSGHFVRHTSFVEMGTWYRYHFLWGNRSLPVKWSSHSSAARPIFWSEHMDGFPDLTSFASALVAGLSGFAFGLIAASLWLYILSPLQTATLIIAFGLIVQGYSVWKLRHAL